MLSQRKRGLVCRNVIGCVFLILASCSSGSNGGGSSGGTNAGGTSGSGGTTSIVSSSSGGSQAGGATSSGGNAGGTAGQTATSGGQAGTSALGGTTSSGGNAGGTAGQIATSGGQAGTSARGGTTSSGGNAGGTAGRTAGAGGSRTGGSSTRSGGAGGTGQYPPPYPRDGTTQLFENDAILVWDVSWLKQDYPVHEHIYDVFGVSYVGGDRVITPPGGVNTTKAWVYLDNVAGCIHVEQGAGEPPMRAVMMEPKSAAPRNDVVETQDGLRKVVGAPSWENERTCAWAIRQGSAAPSHRHVRDAVELVFTAANPATTPTVAFVPEGTVHAGPTPESGGRVYIFEIK